jgi:mono/diheme cytochrome c family protein
MTRSVRIMPAVVGMCALVALSRGCGARQPTPPPGLDEAQLAGWQAYIDLNCASCHGESREGKRSGPPLKGLAEHWSAEQLARYLADPDAVVKANPRLAYKAEQYAIAMPAVSGKSPGYAGKVNEATLASLAEYVLVDVQ